MPKDLHNHSTSAQSQRSTHILDAKGVILGRLATQAVYLLRGKHKSSFALHTDSGDYVSIINAKDIKVTGNKLLNKIYYHHTGYPGHLKSTSLGQMMEHSPQKVIEKAITGMLPKNKLRSQWLKRLKIYSSEETK